MPSIFLNEPSVPDWSLRSITRSSPALISMTSVPPFPSISAFVKSAILIMLLSSLPITVTVASS